DCDTGDVIVEVEPISDEGVLVAGGGTVEEATGAFAEKLASVRSAASAAPRGLGARLEPPVLNATGGGKRSARRRADPRQSSQDGNLHVQMELPRDRGSCPEK